MIYDPLDKFYKNITGAVSANEKVSFRVKGNFDSVILLINKDGAEDNQIEMTRRDGYYDIEISLDPGLYFYCFALPFGEFIGLGTDYVGIKTRTPNRFQLTVYSEDYVVPEWLNGGIIYQIFPDRFNSASSEKNIENGKILHNNWLDTPIFMPNENGQVMNNDFFGGDIKGITQKLNYLKGLGITAIYLNPIFKAYSNHRYDTGDYMKIDELLGDENDLKELIDKANSLGIKIILDGVFNHTGDDSVYFNKYGNYDSVGAYQSKDSKYFKWFNFIEYPDKYESWWGIKTLPSVNEHNTDFIEFITGKDGVLSHYTKLGIGGWRLDVVDELPGEFVKKIRAAVKSVNSNVIVIGEVWEDASNKISYGKRREYFQGKELDSVMNYPLKNAIFEYVKSSYVKSLAVTVKEQIDHYPKKVVHSLMNLLSTHDTVRLLTAVGGKNANGLSKSQLAEIYIPEDKLDDARFRLKVATLLQYTLCGVPSVYYGDEIGMQGYVDPLNRKCFPWGDEDVEILEWYKAIGNIRRKYDAFAQGDYQEMYATDGCFVFKRTGTDSEVLIAVNLSNTNIVLNYEGKLTNILTEKTYEATFELNTRSFAVLVNNI